ncbi:MAG TPA: iron-sulfur cluster assembly accessory protein [Blastocatellia bacterium]|nr:iron-sulfur cluster assembly accessory protein [Blastocatellia bacterium]
MAHLSLTPRAAIELERFLSSEGLPVSTPLRISVEGGGCCELGFGLSLETKPLKRNDEEVNANYFTFIVDSVTAKHLGDSEIDFVTDEFGPRFLFHQLNPQSR